MYLLPSSPTQMGLTLTLGALLILVLSRWPSIQPKQTSTNHRDQSLMTILMIPKIPPTVLCREEFLDMQLTLWMNHLTANVRTVGIGEEKTISVRTVEMTDTCPFVTTDTAQMRTPNLPAVTPDSLRRWNCPLKSMRSNQHLKINSVTFVVGNTQPAPVLLVP